MSVIQDCMICDGRPGGCGRCNGSGIEPPTKHELNQIMSDTIDVLSESGNPKNDVVDLESYKTLRKMK